MKARELCTRGVATIDPEDSVLSAARRMRDEHVGDLVVVAHENGRSLPMGIVTDRDLVVSVLAAALPDASQVLVGDVMSGRLVTAFVDEDLDEVLRRMRKFAVRRVPVLDADGCLHGILSMDDVLAWLREDLGQAVSITRAQIDRDLLERELRNREHAPR
jgi:CBS domain-containing protein